MAYDIKLIYEDLINSTVLKIGPVLVWFISSRYRLLCNDWLLSSVTRVLCDKTAEADKSKSVP